MKGADCPESEVAGKLTVWAVERKNGYVKRKVPVEKTCEKLAGNPAEKVAGKLKVNVKSRRKDSRNTIRKANRKGSRKANSPTERQNNTPTETRTALLSL